MRVVLVGSASARTRLRAALTDSPLEVVGEARTISEARRFDADGLLLATDHADTADPDTGNVDRGNEWDAGDSSDSEYKEPLTRREVEVLELLAEGLPNKAIAARLAISDQTVKFHVSSICGKLGAANRTEAVRRAFRRGIIAL